MQERGCIWAAHSVPTSFSRNNDASSLVEEEVMVESRGRGGGGGRGGCGIDGPVEALGYIIK